MKQKEPKIFFYSDPHFQHHNVIKFCNRPYSNVEEMNEALIRNYNKTVGENDICIWVGDCFWRDKKEAAEIMSRLRGTKILIFGNHDHDKGGMISFYKMGFSAVMEEMWLNIAGHDVQIKHYPFRYPWWKHLYAKLKGWRTKFRSVSPVDKGQFLIHGHVHSKEKFKGRQIHVGVDAWNYRPVPLGVIEKYIREYK